MNHLEYTIKEKEVLIMAGEKWLEKFIKITGQVTEQGKIALDKGLTKASLSVEKSKIRSQIDGVNLEIKKLMNSLGEAAYTQWESGNDDFKTLEGLFHAIQQKKEEIVELNKKIEEIEAQEQRMLENVSQAQSEEECQTAEDMEVTGDLPKDVEVKEEEKTYIICPGCSTQHDNTVKFC